MIESPLRIGIVGLGRRGLFHLERLSLREDSRCVAVHDRGPAPPTAAAIRGGQFYSEWEQFLENTEIEVVLISTPPASHAALACAALTAEKHVVIEKPMCLTVPEADEILDRAARVGRTVSVVYSRRWDSDFRTACSVLHSGKLGDLSSVKLIARQFSPAAPSQGADDWHSQADLGGGVLQELGAHYLDQLLQLVEGPVESVHARLSASRWSNGADDEFQIWLQFQNGVAAQIEVSLASLAPLETGWMLCGDEGGYIGGKYYRATEEAELVDVPIEPLPTDIDAYYAGLVEHLRQRGPLPVTGVEARRVVALIEAARRSAETGRPVYAEESQPTSVRI